MTKAELLAAWAAEICANQDIIDPCDEHDWQSLFVGFAIGKGYPLTEALDYALYMEAFRLEGGA